MKDNSGRCFILIFSIGLLVPFSIDIFLPSLPAMRVNFPGSNMSLIFSLALLGLAIAQPIYGPLLDRFGRRPVLLVGLWLYTLASAPIMVTNSFLLLLVCRFVQAVGACSAVVGIFAIARDVYHGEQLTKIISMIMAMIGVSPAVAPIVGSLLNIIGGWRANFIFLFLIGCLFTLSIHFFFKETCVEKNKSALMVKNILKNYASIAKNPGFIVYSIINGLVFGIWFSYFNLSSLFIIQQMHYNPINYSLIVGANALVISSMSIMAFIIHKKISTAKTILLGLALVFIGGFVMTVWNNYFEATLYSFMLPMFLVTMGIGIIRPQASSHAMKTAHATIAGSGSAFLNFITFVAGSIATMLSSKYVHFIQGFGTFITLMAVAASVILIANLLVRYMLVWTARRIDI